LREFFFEQMDVLEFFTEVFQRADVFVPFGFGGIAVDAIVILSGVLVHRPLEGCVLDGPTDGVGDSRGRGHVGQEGRGGRMRVGQEGEEGGGELFLRRSAGWANELGQSARQTIQIE
jgi:hypothetical protein